MKTGARAEKNSFCSTKLYIPLTLRSGVYSNYSYRTACQFGDMNQKFKFLAFKTSKKLHYETNLEFYGDELKFVVYDSIRLFGAFC
jgi:hypothetical protein